MKDRRREPGRDGEIVRDHRQDGNVVVCGIGKPSTLRSIGRSREIQKRKRKMKYRGMYVELCMIITYSRVWINRVRLPILLVVS